MSTNRFSWLWPSINDISTANSAAKQGVWASAFCAVVTIFTVRLNYLEAAQLGLDMWLLVDTFLFIIIGYGIFKLNRFAAGAGLVLYLLERLYMWIEYGPKNPIMAILITLMYINAIRGTFGFHKFRKQEATA